MIHLEWPWLWLVLPLPLLVRWLLPAYPAFRQAALKVPFLDDFAGSGQQAHPPRTWLLLCAGCAWCLLVFASTRPQWLGEPVEQAVTGRDLMLAVDLSGSMEAQDFFLNKRAVDRLTAAKAVANDFINRRVGDRVGLILFGTQAYLQTPLTFDRKTVQTFLAESEIGLAGDNTAIGDAIGLAVKRLSQQPEASRVLILMTDGANTAGEVPPLKAAELAASNKLKIYTIGIGADEMIVQSFFGVRKVNPSMDLDEDALVKIAETTGGRYFRARDTEGLENFFKLLDQLEPLAKDKQFYRPHSELYVWPLGLAWLITFALAATQAHR